MGYILVLVYGECGESGEMGGLDAPPPPPLSELLFFPPIPLDTVFCGEK